MSVSVHDLPPPLAEWLRALDGGYTDWAEHHPEVHREVQVLDPGVSTSPLRCADIVEVAGLRAGRDDGPTWIAIVRLADGRWAYVAHTMQITGDIYWTYVYAASRDRLWWWACTDDDRERFTAQLDADEQADELVQLDMLLQSEVPANRTLGERRMQQLHVLGKLVR